MSVVVEFHEHLLLATKSEPKSFTRQVKFFTLAQFYLQGKISAGYAAQFLNMDKITFYQLLAENGYPVIDYDEADLLTEGFPLLPKV